MYSDLSAVQFSARSYRATGISRRDYQEARERYSIPPSFRRARAYYRKITSEDYPAEFIGSWERRPVMDEGVGASTVSRGLLVTSVNGDGVNAAATSVLSKTSRSRIGSARRGRRIN